MLASASNDADASRSRSGRSTRLGVIRAPRTGGGRALLGHGHRQHPTALEPPSMPDVSLIRRFLIVASK